MMASGSACDTVGLLTCTTTAHSSITSAANDPAKCTAVDTFVTCVTSACNGCGTSQTAAAQTALDGYKTTYCGGATASCTGSSFCTATLEACAGEAGFSE